MGDGHDRIAGEEWRGGRDLPVPAIDPKNPDVIYITSTVTWKSTDGGKTWTGFRGAPGGDDYQNIWINPNDPNIIALASDQGAIVSVNGGQTWSSWYNQPTAQLYHVNADNAFPRDRETAREDRPIGGGAGFFGQGLRSMSTDRRRQLIDSGHLGLSIVRQCELVSVSRSTFYREPAPETALNLTLMRLVDEQFLETPWYGSRQMMRYLRRQGHTVGRERVRRLMAKMGLAAIYQRPRTTIPHPAHRIYPYLLRDLVIDQPNQVWCTDITYIPMRRGFLYLVAVMDWSTRKVLSWRVSNTMEVDFCIEALEEAMDLFGRPAIFNMIAA